MFTKIEKNDAVSFGLKELGLSENKNNSEVIYNIIRKVTSSLCPCSEHTIIKNSLKHVQFLLQNETIEENDIRQYIRDLINYGDLLQLNEIKVTQEQIFPKNHLHLSPNKYVEIFGNKVALIGIQKETDFPHGTPFQDFIQIDGILNFIDKSRMIDCIQLLKTFHFREIIESDWLNLPSEKNINKFLDKMKFLLSENPNISRLEDLQILSNKGKFFLDRLTKLSTQTGTFLSRQKNVDGSFAWSFSELDNGRVLKHIELPQAFENTSGYDQWCRLLISLDKFNGYQHHTHYQKINQDIYYNFNYPLPKWVERKFIFNGAVKVKNPTRSYLISYKLSKKNENDIDLKDFLFQYLSMEMSIIDGNP